MATRKAGPKVKFGDPPQPRQPAPYNWSDIAAQLRRRPGEWALIFENDKTSYVTSIRLNGISALRRDKGFEVRTENNKRQPPPRTCDLWLRYNPDKDRSNK